MEEIKAQIKYHWSQSKAPYYEQAESDTMLAVFWGKNSRFLQAFENLDLTAGAELACGHGRHTEVITRTRSIGKLTLLDINESNIERCAKRFADNSAISCYVNSGSDLEPIKDNSLTSVFSYDAMVHFEYDDVFSYIRDIHRVLKPGGKALLHHSNNDKQPGNLYSDNTHWRNFMSAPLFKHVSMRSGFEVLHQELIDWSGVKEIDALTLLLKPAYSN